MSQPWTTGQGSELLAPGLRSIFFQAYRDQPTEYTEFTNPRSSKKNFEEDLEMTGLSTMPEKGEGDGISYVVPKQGQKRRYTHVAYALGFRATMESMDDDLYNITARQSEGLGRAGRRAKESVSAGVLNLGFNTTGSIQTGNSPVGFKGDEALMAATHTSIRGITGSNRPSSDVDLSKAALEDALIAFDDLEDEDGFPVVIIPRKLIIPSGLQMVAEELIGSPLNPENANNAINPLSRRGLTWHVNHYLTDADAWFLLGDQHDINFFMRMDMRFQSGDDFDSGDAKFKSVQRFSVGWGDWRGIYGSSGAA